MSDPIAVTIVEAAPVVVTFGVGEYQPLDSELTALAGLTSAADKLPYYTGSGTAALATFTAAGRAILDDADTAAQRTTLGLGSVNNTSDADKPVSTAQAAADAVVLAAATSGSQPLDADLSAIASLATTTFGRSALTLADASAGRTLYGVVIGTNVQAWDADLDAIAALATTTFGRSALILADAAAGRTLYGVVIGTNVQAFDVDLSALAGLTSAADKLPYFTGSATAALADFSVAGRALIDDADATAQRATLGVVIGTNVQAWDADLDAFALKTAPAGAVVGTTDTQTLTGKTLTAPVINNPTGIVKGDVGLGNVDNTSDAAKPVSTAQATANTADKDRANHTGTQAFSTITGTVPVSQGGTGVTALPKFAVHKNGTDQTIGTGAYAKLTWSTEDFDTNNNFASDKFTVTVAGKYLFTASVFWPSASAANTALALYKNGAQIKRLAARNLVTGFDITAQGSVIVDAAVNDFFEIYVLQDSGGDLAVNGSSQVTYFTGSLLP